MHLQDSNKLITGALFILTSAILLSAQFITAAILSVNRNSWSSEAIFSVLGSAGYVLISLSIGSLAAGIFFMVSGLRGQSE
ncbi:hypothetical protein [Halobacillus sp. Marseille-P3879]|uniref:hypothetical protein n=1 Tax=Halobacillus sp. Marseille-P3879 TaxID=2045014 RepID=UPI000C7E3500|nr:hypothetical protein [Halobacillus sp. Marseille-P3879]